MGFEQVCFSRSAITLTIPADQSVLHDQAQAKFGRGKNVLAQRPRRGPVNAIYFSRQSSIRIFATRNLKCPILLQLFDHCISDQHFNMRDKSMVFESWDGEAVNVA